MADEVKAESTGVHQTMTANRLDPGIQADGSMQAGQGVGAQSQQKVHEEGVEHIKGKIDERGSGGPTDTSVGAPSTTVGSTTKEPISEENKTTGTANPATDGSAPGEPTGQASTKDEGEGEGKDGEGKDLQSGADPRTRENHEAIPTAGGEKLGEKHWGESKIIPENPKKQASEGESAGVSSKAGQPTSEVKDNTTKNTGGATGGPAATGTTGHTSTSDTPQEKAKFTDKIKGALKMGKKDKA